MVRKASFYCPLIILVWLILSFLLISAAHAGPVLSWSAPKSDIAGNPLSPDDLAYRVYLRDSSSGAELQPIVVERLFLDLVHQSPGCYDIFVTAHRLDNPTSESSNSDYVSACINDTTSQDTTTIDPQPPTGVALSDDPGADDIIDDSDTSTQPSDDFRRLILDWYERNK